MSYEYKGIGRSNARAQGLVLLSVIHVDSGLCRSKKQFDRSSLGASQLCPHLSLLVFRYSHRPRLTQSI